MSALFYIYDANQYGVIMKKTIAIFTATHVRFNKPSEPIYIPLHVGRAGKEDLGYIGDNTGINISDLNWLYGELTGLFWIWQNVYDIDYVGLCHYRRYFLDNSEIMRREKYLEILGEYDAIVSKHFDCGTKYRNYYGKAHNVNDIDAVGNAIKNIYPEYVESFNTAMIGSIFYSGNLVVTKLEILKGYAEWLFNVFAEASENIDVSKYDSYHKRVYGFLSEQLFYVYLLRNKYTYYEAPVGIAQEKAETRELIDSLKNMISKNEIDNAKKTFDKSLIERPDLLLPGSDINGELEALYQELKLK